jgi:hypothetical protein
MPIASAHHVGRDLARALLVKPVPGCELETAIGPSQRSLETSTEKAVGFDHDHAGSTAVRMAISQVNRDELRGRLRFLCHARSIGRELRFNRLKPRRLRTSGLPRRLRDDFRVAPAYPTKKAISIEWNHSTRPLLVDSLRLPP